MMIRYELHFGLGVKKICCLPTLALKLWISRVVNRPYSLVTAEGFWEGQREDSLILIMIADYDSAERFDTENFLKNIAGQFNAAFSQDATLLCQTLTTCNLVTHTALTKTKAKRTRRTKGD